MADASNAKIIAYFILWYVLNVFYNDFNKTVLKVLDLPWTISALQLGLGLLYIIPLWATGIRAAPKLDIADVKGLMPASLIHAAGQAVTVASLGAGSLAFVNVVKSLEPFFNVVFGALLTGEILPWQVNSCLLPLVFGVGLASAADLSFTWDCFWYAMGSNFFFSLRGVMSKMNMGKPMPASKNMDAGNNFAVLTTIAFLVSLPIALFVEYPKLQPAWEAAISSGTYTGKELAGRILGSGLTFYLYNEVSFYTLGMVHPITHAVGNTIKRVILILFSVIRFGSPMTTQSAIGSAIAVAGVFAYSVAKQTFKSPKKTK